MACNAWLPATGPRGGQAGHARAGSVSGQLCTDEADGTYMGTLEEDLAGVLDEMVKVCAN